MSERFAAVLAILLFELFIILICLSWGFGLLTVLAAAGATGAGAAEAAYRLLGGAGNTSGNNSGHGPKNGPNGDSGASPGISNSNADAFRVIRQFRRIWRMGNA